MPIPYVGTRPEVSEATPNLRRQWAGYKHLGAAPRWVDEQQRNQWIEPSTGKIFVADHDNDRLVYTGHNVAPSTLRTVASRTVTQEVKTTGLPAGVSIEANRQAIERLEPYTDQGGQVNVTAFMRDNPTSRQTLLNAGISNQVINEAYRPRAVVTKTAVEKKEPEVITAKEAPKWGVAATDDIYWQDRQGRVIDNAEYERRVSDYESRKNKLAREGKMYTDEWHALGKHPRDELTVTVPVMARQQIDLLSWFFPPAKALKPDVTIKDVSKLEWGLGVANVVLMASPAITAPLKGVGPLAVTKGGAVIKGSTTAYKAVNAAIQAGAGGLYTYTTVKDWNKLSLRDKVLAVVIDTAILGIAFKTTAGAISGIKAPKQSRFKFDWGKPAQEVTGSVKIKAAISDLEMAVSRKSVPQLKAAAGKLELASADLPGQLGGDFLKARAKLIKANADNFIDLAKKQPRGVDADIVRSGITANEQHLTNLTEQLKKTKNPQTQQAIEKAIKETKKVIVKEKVKVKLMIEKVIEPSQQGANLPTKRAINSLSKSTERVRVGTKSIPLREFATKPLYEIAASHKVSIPRIILAIKTVPVGSQRLITSVMAGEGYDVTDIEKVSNLTEASAIVKTVAMPSARAAISQKTAAAPSVVSGPSTAPTEQVKAASEAKQVTKTETTTAQEEGTETGEEEGTETGEEEGSGKGGLPPLPSTATDQQKRNYIKKSKGAMSWRQGELGEKNDVWYTVVYPYNQKPIVVVGKAPVGARHVEGPGSAFKTAKQLYGNVLPKGFKIDVGFQDVTIDGTRLKYKPDPGLTGTRGRVTAGRPRGRITRR